MPEPPEALALLLDRNAPRADGLLEFHVRLIDGGAVSMALTSDTVRAPRCGSDRPSACSPSASRSRDRSLLLIAGSTGLAPLKAMVDQLTTLPQPPAVHLFFGARKADGLYDLDSLEKIAAEHPWLTVTPVATADPRFEGETGSIPDVVARHGDWSGHDAYLAGPARWCTTPRPGWPRRACPRIRYTSRISGGASLDHSMVRRADQDESRGAADRHLPGIAAWPARLRRGRRPAVPARGACPVRARAERADVAVAGSPAAPAPDHLRSDRR